jgi:hypothetical protein
LVIYPPSAGKVTIFPDTLPVFLAGFSIDQDDSPLVLLLDDHGDLVQRGWRAIGSLVGLVGAAGVDTPFSATGTGTNAVATATQAAVAGTTHFVGGVSFSGSVATVGVLARLLDGAAVLMNWRMHNQVQVSFAEPVRGTAGNSVSCDLVGLGVGNTGDVNIHGFSRLASLANPTVQTVMVTEIFGE